MTLTFHRWVYFDHTVRGTRHLAEHDFAKRTLCGVSTADLLACDETASGYLADCLRCRKAAGLPLRPFS